VSDAFYEINGKSALRDANTTRWP